MINEGEIFDHEEKCEWRKCRRRSKETWVHKSEDAFVGTLIHLVSSMSGLLSLLS